MAGTHDGHRGRLKRRFEKTGLDGFAPHEVLELILFYAIPRRDTNPIAHELIDVFGGIDKVFEADVSELMQVKYIGENAAVLIKLFLDCFKYYTQAKNDVKFFATSAFAVSEYVKTLFVGEKDEMSFLLCFDSSGKHINTTKVSEGSVTATEISIRKIAEIVAKNRASSVILTHNHPGGIAMPSTGDLLVTKKIVKLLNEIGVAFNDHIIVAESETISLASAGVIYNIKCELGI